MSLFQWFRSWIYDQWGWLALWLSAVFLLVMIVVAGGALKIRPWEGTTEERVNWYGGEQCEHVNTRGFVVQQANFWSNLAYLAAGMIMYLRNGTMLGRGAGFALGFLFLSSSLFHGTLTILGQYLDIMGVYMALLALGMYGVFEVWELDQNKPAVCWWFWIVMAIGVFAGGTKSLIPWHDSTWGSVILGGGLFGIGFVGGRKYRKNWRHWLLPATIAVLSFLWALFFKFADGHDKWLCRPGRDVFGPHSIIQGHALWHVLSAFMMLSVFEYYTSLRGKWRTVWPWRG